MLKAEIPGETLTFIRLKEIPYIEAIGIAVDNVLRIVHRTVFNDQHFKLRVGLLRQAVQQLIDLPGTII